MSEAFLKYWLMQCEICLHAKHALCSAEGERADLVAGRHFPKTCPHFIERQKPKLHMYQGILCGLHCCYCVAAESNIWAAMLIEKRAIADLEQAGLWHGINEFKAQRIGRRRRLIARLTDPALIAGYKAPLEKWEKMDRLWKFILPEVESFDLDVVISLP